MFSIVKKLYSSQLRLPILFIVLGILIRFLLMPASAQLDLLLASRREYLWVFKDIFLMNDITETSLGVYLKAIKPLLPHLYTIFDQVNAQGTLGLPELEKFAVFSRAMRYVSLFKAPYLFLDIISLFFVWKFFSNKAKRNIALAFWAFNPFYLYASYLIGRYEVFPVFLLIVAFYFAKKNNPFWSVLVLGIAIATRMPIILLLPFLVIYYSKSWKGALKYSLLGIAPIILITKVIEFSWGHNIFVDTMENPFMDLMIMKPSLGTGFNAISPILLLYPLSVYLFYREREKTTFNKLLNFSIIGFLVFYITGYLGPQYIAWFSPLLMLTLVYNRRILWPTLAFFLVFLILQDIYMYGITTTIGLYILDYDFFAAWGGIRNQGPFYSFGYPVLVTIFHSLLVLCSIILGYILYRDREKNEIEY